MEFALIGAGQRGMTYARYAFYEKKIKIAAVVEPDERRRKQAADEFSIPDNLQFSNAESFFKFGKICEMVIIASMDRDHYTETMAALETGYDILLEKPISPSPEECLDIQRKAEELNKKVIICHVLRYTNFFSEIKKILDSGRLGKIVSIDHSENIGNFHMAHSFVRGNWRNSNLSSPLIMQKSCHDMDLLVWLTDSTAEKISSFGDLTYFIEKNAPENSTERCIDCPAADSCRFDARKQYMPAAGQWPATLLSDSYSKKDVLEVIKTSPYGKCVYKCDNNVCDHQVSIIQFKNGVTATFNLSGFTNKVHRSIHIMCEDGELYGDDDANLIKIIPFRSNDVDKFEEVLIHPEKSEGGHNGGDEGLMEEVISLMEDRRGMNKDSKSSIGRSVESHIMAYAAEKSRVTEKTVFLDDLKMELIKK